ncbi:MAG: TetR/AcrR family transcriptional regulator [Steroidobacteraceae bacterium]
MKKSASKPTRTPASRLKDAPGRARREQAAPRRLGPTYRPGRATQQAIVEAAEAVLIEHGHARFTIQRVADKLGISPGNVNYYFSTKASLLETLILFTLMQYRRRVRSAGKNINSGTAEALGEVVRWLMADAVTPRTNRLFRELWAIALNDARLARALDQFYARSVSAHLRRLTDRSAVSAESERLEAIVFLLHAISEGTTVLFGMQLRSSELFERVRGVAHEAIMKLLLEPASAK